MPVKRFWLMSQSLDRIEAQRAIRNLTVASAAQGDPNILRDQLIREVGTVSTGQAERDEQGFAGLKALSQNN